LKNIRKNHSLFLEKATVHNKLLQQIQSGIQLKPTKTNDRSRPFLQGLRKFRRQMTIEEQIQKSESKHVMEAEPNTPNDDTADELDDIDKLRDDLQSTKQMLALELRNKEALERDNKRLSARVQNLEAELARERWNPMEKPEDASADENLVNKLRNEVDETQKQSQQLEKKYHETATQLDLAKIEVDDLKRLVACLERKLQV
jgi:hypothetical protein